MTAAGNIPSSTAMSLSPRTPSPSSASASAPPAALAAPVLPLVRLVTMLFLATPLDDPAELLGQLPSPIDTGDVTYADPAAALAPYEDILTDLTLFKTDAPLPATILEVNGEPADRISALDCWLGQRILERELEAINTLLCGPCHCDLCCTGPTGEQFFFEIPLQDQELALFPSLDHIDTPASRKATAYDEPPLNINGRPFYQRTSPCLIRWRTGPSLILPRGSRCPRLDQGRCAVYPQRPQVCRRPQIFPYLLEAEKPQQGAARTFRIRRTLLAVWDCPYVRRLEDAIAAYGRLCGLEVLFRTNKG